MAATFMLIQAMDVLGFPYGAVDTSETTAYQAIVTHCTDSSFTPAYMSEGRLYDYRAGISSFAEVPKDLEIHAYPNPFNSTCIIEIENPLLTSSQIDIYSIDGRLVDNLTIQTDNKNITHYAKWTPHKTLSSGIYFAKAKTGNRTITRKIVLLR